MQGNGSTFVDPAAVNANLLGYNETATVGPNSYVGVVAGSATINESNSITATGSSVTVTVNGSGDTLEGAGGNDTVIGGGLETYAFGPGYGHETIQAGSGCVAGILSLTAGVNEGQLWFAHSGNDLVISVLGTQAVLTIKGWAAASPINTLTLSNEGSIGVSQINAIASAMDAYSAANPSFNPSATGATMPASLFSTLDFSPLTWARTIIATPGNDTISSLYGPDTYDALDANPHQFIGGLGSDVFISRAGDDTIYGNPGGGKVYEFMANDHQDTVYNGSGNSGPANILEFLGPEFTTNRIWLQQVNQDLVVDALGTNDQVTIKGWFNPGAHAEQLSSIMAESGGATTQFTSAAAVSSLVQAMATFAANYQVAQGMAFNPQSPSNALITDPTLLSAVNAAWHS